MFKTITRYGNTSTKKKYKNFLARFVIIDES